MPKPAEPAEPTPRAARGLRAQSSGLRAEATCIAALVAEGWTILAQRLRTAAGEIDLVAERRGLLAIIEVKHRPHLATAAAALSARQRTRLLAAGQILLADHPDWGRAGVRFDVMVVDAQLRVRRIADAFRLEE